MAAKPTIFFVPGAWHLPDAFKEVATQLNAVGYRTRLISLPSIGAVPPTADFSPDVDVIRTEIQTSVDEGQDVIIFMHSYGSVPACQAAKGFDKASREKEGKQGGVAGLFFCAAFIMPEGASLLDGLGGQPLPWFVISDNDTVVNVANPEDVFYNDLDKETAQLWVSQLKHQSYKVMSSKPTYAAWRDIPCTYLFCEDDQALPFFVQKQLVASSNVPFRTESVKASHSPFLSVPDKVTAAIRRCAGEVV